MAARLTKINLIPKDSFEYTTLGKVLKWSLSTGRVLVVLTEFVVILAFGSRFYFDKKSNDLIETIDQKQALVESYAEIEKIIREVLLKQRIVDDYLKNNLGVSGRVDQIKKITPADVTYSQITIDDTGISLSGSAGSENALAGIVSGVSSIQGVTDVNIGSVEFNQKLGTIDFKITAIIGKQS